MRAILEYDFPTNRWYAWMEDSAHMQITGRYGPFPSGLESAKCLFANVGEARRAGGGGESGPWVDEYVGG